MKLQISLFTKMAGIVIGLLFSILLVFGYDNYRNNQFVQQELLNSSLNQLFTLSDQLGAKVNELVNFSTMLGADPTVTAFINMSQFRPFFDPFQTKLTLSEKLNLQSAANDWPHQISVFSLRSKDVVSTDPLVSYDEKTLSEQLATVWQYRARKHNGETEHYFVLDTILPSSIHRNLSNADMVVEVSFLDQNIRKLLDSFTTGSTGRVFLYHQGYDPIIGTKSDMPDGMLHFLSSALKSESGRETPVLNGKRYSVNYVRLKSLDWYLIGYVPIETVLEPLRYSSNLFYVAIALFLSLSIVAVFLLYRNVQSPIRQLMRSLHIMKSGNYSVRLQPSGHDEFRFVFLRFNEMAEEMQELIEKNLSEKLRSQDAMLKLLQAQINPHFLYNSLAFIKSMIRMGHDEAAIEMVFNLGEYYRYVTRIGSLTTLLKDELAMIKNYLAIQQLRMDRIRFEVDIPENLLECSIPRLLLQPVVENAIIHGIEPHTSAGLIRITGQTVGQVRRLVVENDGPGLSSDIREALENKLFLPLEKSDSRGMWNVHQRLQLLFGKESGIRLTDSPLGGLRVSIEWSE